MNTSAISYPKTFGDFKVIGEIGNGAFSTVVKAFNVKTKEIYACKIINRTFIIENDLLELLERELRIMERLRHNNIAEMHKILYLENFIIIIMEYCSKGSLYDYVAFQGRMSEQEIYNITRQILEALEFLHTRNISHRDIKLDNIVLTRDFVPKLIDFGLSVIGEKQNSLRNTLCGTLEYIAPEILRGEVYDPKKADIWAVGICAYTMAMGHFPWDSNKKSIKKCVLEDEVELPDIFSPRFRKFVLSMLNRDPTKRPIASELIAMTEPYTIIRHRSNNGKSKIIKPIMRISSQDIGFPAKNRIFQVTSKNAILCK